jgi:hypothetical protein
MINFVYSSLWGLQEYVVKLSVSSTSKVRTAAMLVFLRTKEKVSYMASGGVVFVPNFMNIQQLGDKLFTCTFSGYMRR